MHILGFANNLYQTYLDPRTLDGSKYSGTSYVSASAKLHGSRP